jgi:hypothetical protein
MNAWKGPSPYRAVGTYIGGVNRGCDQPNRNAAWVTAQFGNGWRFFPLYVGLQVQRTDSCDDCELITDPAPEGAEAARGAADDAAALDFAKGSVLYFDMESYDRGGSNTTKSMTFLDAWSDTLHQLGYRSGVYGQVSGVILDLVDAAGGGQYTMPDVIDFAHWDGDGGTGDSQIPANLWPDHQRIKQYQGGHDETYGGMTISIDSDTLDVGAGSTDTTTVAPACTQNISTLLLSAKALCAKVAAGPGTVTSTANLQEASIGLVGLPVIGLSGVKASSTSTCTAQTGSVDLGLTVAGSRSPSVTRPTSTSIWASSAPSSSSTSRPGTPTAA